MRNALRIWLLFNLALLIATIAQGIHAFKKNTLEDWLALTAFIILNIVVNKAWYMAGVDCADELFG